MLDLEYRRNSAKRLEWRLYTAIELESSTPQTSDRAIGHNPEPLPYTFHSVYFSKISFNIIIQFPRCF
jgi:hypothetical protein